MLAELDSPAILDRIFVVESKIGKQDSMSVGSSILPKQQMSEAQYGCAGNRKLPMYALISCHWSLQQINLVHLLVYPKWVVT